MKFQWPGSSPGPKLLDDVTDLLLGYSFHTLGNELLLTESLYKELCPVLWVEAEMKITDLQAVGCRCNSNAQPIAQKASGVIYPFTPRMFHCHSSVSLNP